MSRVGVLLCCLIGAGCGRIAFDTVGDATSNDGAPDVISADAPAARSCVGLGSTCGAAGTSPCCESSLVPGGTFFRSYDVGTDNMYVDTTHPATINDFRLDRYEVTVGRFRQFVNAGMGTRQQPPEPGAGSRPLNGQASQAGWDPTWNGYLTVDTNALVAAIKCDATWQAWTDTPGANESLPMNCILWHEAMAFCVWDGGFLPTEAEWNYAASGGDEQRVYPWSSPPSSPSFDCSYANAFDGAYCTNPPTGGLNRVGSESPKGDGRWGHADLAGSLKEWTLDAYVIPYTDPCTDCANLAFGVGWTNRGGAFQTSAPELRAASRSGNSQTRGESTVIGVRCARAL